MDLIFRNKSLHLIRLAVNGLPRRRLGPKREATVSLSSEKVAIPGVRLMKVLLSCVVFLAASSRIADGGRAGAVGFQQAARRHRAAACRGHRQRAPATTSGHAGRQHGRAELPLAAGYLEVLRADLGVQPLRPDREPRTRPTSSIPGSPMAATIIRTHRRDRACGRQARHERQGEGLRAVVAGDPAPLPLPGRQRRTHAIR
jgi:hypothetical protein